jgi:excisionase family DNA binding protein
MDESAQKAMMPLGFQAYLVIGAEGEGGSTECASVSEWGTHRNCDTESISHLEPFVSAERAAEFLAMSRKTLLALARKGYLPGHPVSQGVRKTWKFRLSELDQWMRAELMAPRREGESPIP